MSPTLPSPFELLGLESTFDLDLKALEESLFQASLKWHPDRYALAPVDERIAAEDQMAAINEAHDLLADPLRRAEFLLSTLGSNPNQDKQRNADPEFLMEMMELREEVETALGDGQDAEVALKLRSNLLAKENQILSEFGTCWQSLPSAPGTNDLAKVQRLYEHARYLRSTKAQVQQALQPRL